MYLKKIELTNVGPIDSIIKELPFSNNDNPKPLIIIGPNGSGKSIFISYIVNALIFAKQIFYEDSEVDSGKVYKYRSYHYIKSGRTFSRAKVLFEQNYYMSEGMLDRKKSDFENYYKYLPIDKKWSKADDDEDSFIDFNFKKENTLKNLIDNNCVLYFPPNRFEEPGWLNYENLIARADYQFMKRVRSKSNRLIINYSPLKDNQNWLLDVLFDKYALDLKLLPSKDIQEEKVEKDDIPVFIKFQGDSSIIYDEVIKFLRYLFLTENISLRYGIRRNRVISIFKNNNQWVPNLFNLSTGETTLLNIFLTIIKDFDLTSTEFKSLSDIRGIVIIDDIDLHLHTDLQYNVLPKLIKLFPKVQFIITSHSPLFLLGMQNELGIDNFEIIQLPDGDNVSIESFSEFENAYNYFKESIKFENDIKEEISKSQKALLFVEGSTDKLYLEKAADLLNQVELLNLFEIIDSNGESNIYKIYNKFDSKLSEVVPQKIILLCDCETNKPDQNKGNVHLRRIPFYSNNPIKKGIEHLFPKLTIDKALAANMRFFDITPAYSKKVRGEDEIVPESCKVNHNEKMNLCKWIIENGTAEDFFNFNSVFGILKNVIIES